MQNSPLLLISSFFIPFLKLEEKKPSCLKSTRWLHITKMEKPASSNLWEQMP